MFTITVKLDEKVSTSSQYENKTCGVFLEQSNIEVASPEELLQKARDLFHLARKAVDEQLGGAAKAPAPQPVPSNGADGNGHPAQDNGNGRRSYGRPQDAPSPKQRAFLAKLARQRKLGPESIRDMAVRMVGKDPRVFTKQDMSKFLEALLAAEQAA